MTACTACDGLGWIEIETQSSFGEGAIKDSLRTDCFQCQGTGDERNMPRWMREGRGVACRPALGRAEAPQPPSRLRPSGAIANAGRAA